MDMRKCRLVLVLCFFAAVIGYLRGDTWVRGFECPSYNNSACGKDACVPWTGDPTKYIKIISNAPYKSCIDNSKMDCLHGTTTCSGDIYLDANCNMAAGGGVAQQTVGSCSDSRPGGIE